MWAIDHLTGDGLSVIAKQQIQSIMFQQPGQIDFDGYQRLTDPTGRERGDLDRRSIPPWETICKSGYNTKFCLKGVNRQSAVCRERIAR